MTREEAIKDLQENGVDLGAGDFVDVESLCMAISALREQPRWISVEERLPETEMHGTSRVVLAWVPEHGRCFAMVYDKGQGKRWFSGGAEIPNITHWMPLPDAPEVEV